MFVLSVAIPLVDDHVVTAAWLRITAVELSDVRTLPTVNQTSLPESGA